MTHRRNAYGDDTLHTNQILASIKRVLDVVKVENYVLKNMYMNTLDFSMSFKQIFLRQLYVIMRF